MIIPTPGRLVLQKVDEKQEEEKKGSLILLNLKPKQDRYKVINICSVFSSAISRPTLGDTVYIDKYKGVEITEGDQVYLVVNDDDIIAYESE